ncbi:MAG: HD domain-containing protein [Chloroflexota bacterium]
MFFSQDAYTRAWYFAAEAHGDQKVPGSDMPYIAHVGHVTMEVIASFEPDPPDSPDLAVQCALLHDVIEDTRIEVDNVEAMFGPEVTAGVLALSKDKSLKTKGEQMLDSLNRIQMQPLEVWRVKLADRIANLRQPPHYWSVDKIANYQAEARLIHDALHPASDYLADRLAQKIEQYGRWIKQ